MVKPTSVGVAVALANALIRKTPRRVDFVHIPAARKAFEASYYEDLSNLDLGDAKLYLGLIHDSETDLSEFQRRYAAAKDVMADFGVASVCGYGRCDQHELEHALQVHRAVMDHIAGA